MIRRANEAKQKTMILQFQKTKYLFAFAVFIFLPVLAQAQEKLGFSISPTIFDMTANPGQSWETSIRLINSNRTDLQLYIEPVNFTPREESGVPDFQSIENDPARSATFAEWINVPESILVPAEKTVELPIEITVPQDGDPGGHFAALLIGTKPPETNGNTQVSTSQIISTLFFLRVTGDVNEAASIRSFRTTNYLVNQPSTTFELRIENRGNVHVQPQGKITIYNMWGQKRGEVLVNQQTLFGKVLPNSVRKYSFDWQSDWSIADIGRYTAKAVLSYGNTDKQSLTSETAFWVVPWKWVLMIIGVISIFVYGFVIALRAYIRRVLTLSGLQPITSESSVSLTPKTKRLGIIAPFEVGMLDLRKELYGSKSHQERLQAILQFSKKYHYFFYFLLGLIIFIGVLWWYMQAAFEDKNFEIVTDSGEVVTPKSNEEIVRPGVTENEKTPVILVDRSGSPLGFGDAITKIQTRNFYVQDTRTEPIEERTVIVFSPSMTDEALELSMLFGNAPLSALSEEEGNNAELIVFIGSDIVSKQ